MISMTYVRIRLLDKLTQFHQNRAPDPPRQRHFKVADGWLNGGRVLYYNTVSDGYCDFIQ